MGRLTHRTKPGWTYFITTKAAQNISAFQVKEVADIVITKMLEYRSKGHYLVHDFVLMPNHLHVILTPTGSVSLEKCMQLIKGGSSHEIHKIRSDKMQIWQSGFHESRVIDSTDYNRKTDYIRFNPVVAKLVGRPENYPFSSASGQFECDPIPQGLKPITHSSPNVGPKGPTPGIRPTPAIRSGSAGA
jgi:REP-associated tyrosine transposase